MKDKVLYAKVGVSKVKVGRIEYDRETGENKFIKHKAHYMNILKGYGIQQFVQDESGKEWNLKEVFKKHPELKIVIPDAERESVFYSTAQDWNERGVVKNYGMGAQLFLSSEYMKTQAGQLQMI